MDGTKACRSPAGMFMGVLLMAMGADQVEPPSVDCEKAMLVYWPPEKRESSQTAYRVPLWGSTATSEISFTGLWVKTRNPVSGSVTAAGCILLVRIGLPWGSQVWPLS